MVYTTGTGTQEGPFLWRIEARGEEGTHRSLTVHGLKVTTSLTKRSEWFPRSWLGHSEEFKPIKGEPGKVFAQYQGPGKLEVYPQEDGQITILVDLSVATESRTARKVVKFVMDPAETKDVEFFFPAGRGGEGIWGGGPAGMEMVRIYACMMGCIPGDCSGPGDGLWSVECRV
jgi:hypothetical protein